MAYKRPQLKPGLPGLAVSKLSWLSVFSKDYHISDYFECADLTRVCLPEPGLLAHTLF